MTAEAMGGGEALFSEALNHLIGNEVPRDLVKSRQLFRAAMSQGHLEAAFFEVALAANGTGGEPDWSLALETLRQVSTRSKVAQSQLALIDKLQLTDDGYPAILPKGEVIGRDPDVVLYPNLISPEECAVIATSVRDILEPSQVVDPRSGRLVAHPIRTSAGAVIGPTRENLVIAAVNRRLAAISGTTVSQGEPLSVLCYGRGEEYRAHVDAIAGECNQRIATAIIYLNEGYEGGETLFLRSDLRIVGRLGDVILFHNVDKDGLPDHGTAHAGLPVRAGIKWVATRWIRARFHDPWSSRSPY